MMRLLAMMSMMKFSDVLSKFEKKIKMLDMFYGNMPDVIMVTFLMWQ